MPLDIYKYIIENVPQQANIIKTYKTHDFKTRRKERVKHLLTWLTSFSAGFIMQLNVYAGKLRSDVHVLRCIRCMLIIQYL